MPESSACTPHSKNSARRQGPRKARRSATWLKCWDAAGKCW